MPVCPARTVTEVPLLSSVKPAGNVGESQVVTVSARAEILHGCLEGGRQLGAIERNGEHGVRRDSEINPRRRGREW